MNNTYSFVLGHSSKLSYAEIISFFKMQKIDFSILEFENTYLILKTKNKLNVSDVMKNLGGIIKIGEVEFQMTAVDKIEHFSEIFIEYIKSHYDISRKLKIGFSFYNTNNRSILFSERDRIRIKRKLQDQGVRLRIVSSKKKDLSAVIVKKEELLMERGLDMQILQSKDKIYCSKTVAIQDFEHFGIIDYGRPKTDSASGMMPPKLSQIMLNLSQSRGTIYDPFCGSGTILLMASDLNFFKLIGSDISEKAVSDSIQNIKWYEATFDKKINYNIFQSDIIELLKKEKLGVIDCIVTEGYLGRPMRGNETLEFIQKQIKELETLYLKSFEVFSKILYSKSSIVIAMPVFSFTTKLLYLNILDEIEKFGFKRIDLVDEKYLGKRKTLIYKREDQKVYREIIKFVKL